ncbi:MAG: TonB family protein [Gammaproteobacteria bacterium]|nr:TonB family protein [Gammaproteobacteria bacterium]
MSAAIQALLDAGVEALGWTLLHFLWQGALAGAVFALLMKVLARASAGLRYATGLCVFVGLALTPVITFWYMLDLAPMAAAAAVAQQTVLVTVGSGTDWWAHIETPVQAVLPWLVLAWLAGVIVLSWRLARDWAEVRALVRSCTQPLPPFWRETAERLQIAFGIRRPVRVLESALVHVPMVIGWLKPVILIPPAALLGLTAKQLELLVAHELAHIRRLDYAVNLFQVAVETLLFYHPVVRWMSARIREERELCCDDLVVAKSGEKLAYARALAEMEGLRSTVPCMGMAADGGQLISRINRLVALPAPQRGTAHWLLGILLVATGTSVMTTLHFAVRSFEAPRAPLEPVPLIRPAAEPAPIEESVAPPMPGIEPAEVRMPVAIEQPIVDASPPDEPVETAASPLQAEDVMPATTPVANASQPATPAPAQPVPALAEIRTAPAIDEPAPAVPAAPIRENRDEQPEAPESPADDDASAGAATRLAMLREPAVKPAPQMPVATAQEEAAATATAARASNPDEVANGLTGGTPLLVTQPNFPRRARLKGVEGAVTVAFTVTRKGRVSDVRIIDAEPAGVFDREVTRTVQQWRFEPFRLDGAPVDRAIERTIQFELDPSAPPTADTDCMMLTGSRLCRSNSFSQGRGVEVAYQARK